MISIKHMNMKPRMSADERGFAHAARDNMPEVLWHAKDICAPFPSVPTRQFFF